MIYIYTGYFYLLHCIIINIIPIAYHYLFIYYYYYNVDFGEFLRVIEKQKARNATIDDDSDMGKFYLQYIHYIYT